MDQFTLETAFFILITLAGIAWVAGELKMEPSFFQRQEMRSELQEDRAGNGRSAETD